MAYATAEARQELLDTLAEATDAVGVALAAIGGAYEQLDEHGGDRLEEQLFRPIQLAYGRARAAHTGFAQRTGLPVREFKGATPGHPSQGVKGFIEAAADALRRADGTLAELQDSMLPVEVGDPELRAALAGVRELIADLPARARRFVSTFGR
jgi:hypothetical protein